MNELIYGTLKKNDIGRWEIKECEFSSGSYLEISLEGHWIAGHIEYGTSGYYFHTKKDYIVIPLYEGMNVRC